MFIAFKIYFFNTVMIVIIIELAFEQYGGVPRLFKRITFTDISVIIISMFFVGRELVSKYAYLLNTVYKLKKD